MPIVGLLLLSALWGSTFLWTKLLLIDFHPISIVFYRCLFGILFLLPFLIKQGAFAKMKFSYSLLIVSLLGATIPWTLMTVSVQYLETTVTGILNALNPLFAMILSIYVLKIRAKFQEWLSLLLGFFGVVFIFLMKNQSIQTDEFYGVTVFLFAILSYSLTSILSTKYQKQNSPFILAFTTLFAATIVCGFIMLFVQPHSYLYVFEKANFSVLLIFGMLSSGLGYVVFYYLVAYGGPVYALFTTYLMPIVALLLGYFVLGESITSSMLVGLLLIFASISLLNYQKRKEKILRESA